MIPQQIFNRLIHPRRSLRSLASKAVRWRIPVVVPQVVRALPHDVGSRTQGLAYQDGLLYESCAGRKSSSLHCLDAGDGSTLKSVCIPGDVAEGIAIIGDRLWQLSWKSGRGRLYQVSNLQQIDEFNYEGEGWGLTAGADGLIMSDGSNRLALRDPDFRIQRHVSVRSNGVPVQRLNDLAWADGRLYANVWGSSNLFELSLDSGALLRIVDCSALAAAAADVPETTMNGIAYNPVRNTLFASGKHWDRIFELAIPD